jgi:hypothetical protein
MLKPPDSRESESIPPGVVADRRGSTRSYIAIIV